MAFFYIKHYSKIEDVKFDIETVTADDYTVQLMISLSQQDKFKSDHQHQIDRFNGSVALALKQYLIEELSRKMTEQGKCRM